MTGWTGTDALVLVAVAAIGAGTPRELVATIDLVNHDVPPAAEVVPSIGRLVGAGLLVVDGGPTLVAAEAGRELVARGQGDGWLARATAVLAILPGVPEPDSTWTISEAIYDAAIADYLGR